MAHERNDSKRTELAVAQSAMAEMVAIEQACEELMQCDCPQTVRRFLDQAEALRHFARNAKMGLELVNKAAEMKIRAERRMGQLLSEMHLHGGDRVSEMHHARTTLEELNISQNQSTRCQKAAEVPEDAFRELIEAARVQEFELTTAAVLKLATTLRKRRQKTTPPTLSLSPQNNATCCPMEIIAELENHCSVIDAILAPIYDAIGPVDLQCGEKKYLRRLLRDVRALLDDLKKQEASQARS